MYETYLQREDEAVLLRETPDFKVGEKVRVVADFIYGGYYCKGINRYDEVKIAWIPSSFLKEVGS